MEQFQYLFLIALPLVTVCGNAMVIIAVLRDPVLKTSTNYMLVSLACADLLVAILVMPFGIYTLINNLMWDMPAALCVVYLMGDVSASTASIVHMVAISADRFYAVCFHLNYKTHKHRLFVFISIILCWVFSIGLTLPATIGFRHDNRTCYIDSPAFMLYGSVFGFIIPCILMFSAYGFVFYKLKQRFNNVKRRQMSGTQVKPGSQFLETMLSMAHGGGDQMRRNTINWAMPFVMQTMDHEDFLDDTDSVSSRDLEELTTILIQMESTSTVSDVPGNMQALLDRQYRTKGTVLSKSSFERLFRQYSRLSRTFSRKRKKSMHAASKQLRRLGYRAADVFTRVKSKQGKAIRKETKATQLVVAVLVVFLMCWLPFFVLNITKAAWLYNAVESEWPAYGDVLFHVFTWLGYFNSGINPIIYTVLNKKFRDAFKRLLGVRRSSVTAEEKRREKTVRLRDLQLRSMELCGADLVYPRDDAAEIRQRLNDVYL